MPPPSRSFALRWPNTTTPGSGGRAVWSRTKPPSLLFLFLPTLAAVRMCDAWIQGKRWNERTNARPFTKRPSPVLCERSLPSPPPANHTRKPPLPPKSRVVDPTCVIPTSLFFFQKKKRRETTVRKGKFRQKPRLTVLKKVCTNQSVLATAG